MEPNKSRIYTQFIQKIGFYPDKKLGDHELTYFLYDFSDQCLIYHLFLNSLQGLKTKNSNFFKNVQISRGGIKKGFTVP